MSENSARQRPVKTLPPETARKIAAGEVIDRPAAIVRELLDNSVDSGAKNVHVEIDGGGIEKIRVADDGCGMTKEDLENCAKPHATSKIISETDLLNLDTLGFRGEALASIAAVSRLEITSIRSDYAWKLEADISGNHRLYPAQLARGSVVQSRGLFENFPARRVFLKRPASEAQLCKQVFIEKSLPQTETTFRLSIDGKLKLDLPSGQSPAERFTAAFDFKEPPELFYQISGGDESADFSFTCVLGEPAVHRSDKKSIYIYINGRRIWEYALVQAIEYGSQGYFPNGTFPAACLFVRLNPALVDFNIHPAKKEARFKDLSALHRAVSSTVRDFYKNHSASRLVRQISPVFENAGRDLFEGNADNFFNGKEAIPDGAGFAGDSVKGMYRQSSIMPDFLSAYRRQYRYRQTGTDEPQPTDRFSPQQTLQTGEQSDRQSGEPDNKITPTCASTAQFAAQTHAQKTAFSRGNLKYVGCALGVFIIIEKDEKLYLIDQHAAQERILYDAFMASAGQKQELIFPYVIETETEAEDAYLETILDELKKTGFTLKNSGGGRWEASAVPLKWNGTEEDLSRDLLKNRVKPAEICAKLAASHVCRCAVKDGTLLDSATAFDLAAAALNLPDPHCPHGRPLWTTISKAELFRLVRRIE